MVTGEIHRGSRYVVSRAHRVGTDVPVVVKAVRGEPADTVAVSRLRQEYELLAKLDVPGVVRAIGFEPVGGRPAMILEDAGGQSLKQWLHRREVTSASFLGIALQLAEALALLHERNIIHRDLNPWNVILDQGARATLIDFEAATSVPRAKAPTGVPAGVPARLDAELSYVAPEETGRMNRLVDQRADLYSLGAVFYEMLTGRPPFVSTDPVELVHAHLARTPVPPVEVNPVIPTVLSDLVVRLLAKMPEARYQSARALLEDLREAEARLRRDGVIAPFELGRLDLAEELRLPERLYQRDEQRAGLFGAWQEAVAGRGAVVLLTGPAGVGKSALVDELREPVARQRGRYLAAKFDAQGGRAPLAAFAEAFRALAAELLAGTPSEVAAWRRRIEHALGENARVLTDLAPELERLLGPAPPLPAVGPIETERRLHLGVEAFVRVLSTREQPLVLFLDDVQWADRASLRLFEALATVPDLGFLLLVLTMRTEEHAADPDITHTFERLALAPASSRSFRRIPVPPLDTSAVVDFCAEALRCERSRAQPLAELIQRKTAGNPFFIRRMLRFLHQSGLLTLDAGTDTWTWDLGAIEKVDVAENVVDLLLVVLQRLPDPVRALLKTAACIGSTVPLGLLAAASNLAPDDASARLRTAVRAGLLVADEHAGPEPARASYRFAHDRIRQAAYLLLEDAAHKVVHVRIGRQLLEEASDEHAIDERLYAIVDQLDRGLDLITEPGERLRLSRLNLRAARKARGSSAYGPALDYLKCAIALLPDDAWESHRRETFALHREAVDLAGMAGELAVAKELFVRTLARAESVAEKADLYTVRIESLSAADRRDEGFVLALEALRLFDIELPLDDPAGAGARELAAVTANLRGRTPAQLLEAPRMRDPDRLACMELMTRLHDVLYFQRPELFPFLISRSVNMSLEYGNAPASIQSYAGFAVFLGAAVQDYRTAHAFGLLALNLAARLEERLHEMRVTAMFVTSVNNWIAPLASSLPLAQAGLAAALRAGDLYYAAAFSITDAMIRLHQGADLGQLIVQMRASIALFRRARYQPGAEDHLVQLQAVRALQGTPLQADDLRLAGVELDADGQLMLLNEASGKQAEYQILRLGVACLLRDFAQASAIASSVAGELNRVPRFVQHVEHNFFSSITLAARAGHAAKDDSERAAMLAAIKANQEQLGIWARNSPENYAHKHLLVAAELTRLEGRTLEAADLYDRAITAATREGFLQDQALADELAGRFYLALGRKRVAIMYLTAAGEAYGRWGAKAKVDALEAEFVELMVTPEALRTAGDRGPTHDPTGGAALDLAALFRAAEAVSSEVMLPRLLAKLMEVCLATAGAQRGAFVVEEEGSLYVRALGAIAEPIVVQRTPVESSPHLPGNVVRAVSQSGDALVVADASCHEELATDPYVQAHGVRSLLVLPIVRQGKVMGVLYLENNLATRAFTPERVRLLVTLSSQIATALQNSLLFEQLRQEVEERKRAEAAVRFLADAGATLAESLEYQSTLKKLAQLSVPVLGDWCAVHVVADGRVQWTAGAHVDPHKQRLLDQRLDDDVGKALPRHVSEVLAAGGPVLHSEVNRAVVERYADSPEQVRLFEELGTASSMILPLRAHGRFLGTMALTSHRPERRFGAPDVAAAEELARRAALAIDNARLYREAQEAIRLRDDFLSIASHELNTPIASLRLASEVLQEQPGVAASAEPGGPGDVPAVPPPAVLKKVTKIIVRQSQRLATLVSDLLDVAQIPTGSFKLRLARVELAALVRDTVELFRGDLEAAKCRLTLHTEGVFEGHWDRARLQQVVANLLSNAIKFAAGTAIEITVSSGKAGWARLIVEDQGMGIPPERLPHIFGRFERAVSATHFGGLGLGLYIVQAVVTALGGTVNVTSELGQGARFTVELPLSGPAQG